MDALKAIGAFFSSLGAIFNFARDRSKLNNAPPIVANVEAKRDLGEKEKIESTVDQSEKTGKLDEERKLFAED